MIRTLVLLALVGTASANVPPIIPRIGIITRPPPSVVIDCTRPGSNCITPPPVVSKPPQSVPEPAGLMILATGAAAVFARSLGKRKPKGVRWACGCDGASHEEYAEHGCRVHGYWSA